MRYHDSASEELVDTTLWNEAVLWIKQLREVRTYKTYIACP